MLPDLEAKATPLLCPELLQGLSLMRREVSIAGIHILIATKHSYTCVCISIYIYVWMDALGTGECGGGVGEAFP